MHARSYFEPEEFPKLIRSESAEAEMDQPKQEERQHPGAGNANRGGNMVRNVGIIMAEDCLHHIRHQARAGEHWSHDD